MDAVTDIAVGRGTGNVYVTGWRSTGDGNTEWVTVAYAPDRDSNLEPTRLWAAPAIYSGPWAGQNKPWAIALDEVQRRVYVTGQAAGPDGTLAMTTVCYGLDGALGGQQTDWPTPIGFPTEVGVRRYATYAGDSIGRDVGVDHDGYVYVAGSSPSAAGDLDYVVVKINHNGHWDSSWPVEPGQPEAGVRRYDGPGGGDDVPVQMITDSTNPKIVTTLWLYLTGTSDGGPGYGNDIATMQINQRTGGIGVPDPGDPTPGWGQVVRYNGPASGNDTAAGLVVLGRDVYVAGTMKSLPLGPGTLAPGGPVPNPNYDFVTLRYIPTSPVRRWARNYDGPDHLEDVAYAIDGGFVDGSPRVWVAGMSRGALTGFDIKVACYSGDDFGTSLWPDPAGRWDASPDDRAFDIAYLDGLYVAGQTTTPANDTNWLVMRLDASTGLTSPPVWTTQYGPVAAQSDSAYKIVVNKSHVGPPNDNFEPRVVVGGFAVHPNSAEDVVTIRYIQE